MSVLCQVITQSGYENRVVSKGAPEVLKKYMKDLPADYDDIYLPYVKDGGRVLALAWKPV
jgi:magnesium-transporting ATPase (P-type)